LSDKNQIESKKMPKVSFIIPSRNETYEVAPGITVLQRTIQDIYEKAAGDFEVLVAFDGPPYQPLPKHPNLRTFNLPESQGLKHSLNLLAKKAKGKYLLKLDSHCMVSEGIDEILASDMEDNWIVTPRFRTLNAEEWKWQDEKFYDYFYLPCPLTDTQMFRFRAGGHWIERTREKLDASIDENMKLHGSSFFIARKFFVETLGGVKEGWIDPSSGEDIELSLKTWLGPWDGRLMVNKNCWYAHMHKGGQRPRGWGISIRQIINAYLSIAEYWMKDSWKEAVHPLSWLIDRFWPVPTWPENYQELWTKWKEEKK